MLYGCNLKKSYRRTGKFSGALYLRGCPKSPSFRTRTFAPGYVVQTRRRVIGA